MSIESKPYQEDITVSNKKKVLSFIILFSFVMKANESYNLPKNTIGMGWNVLTRVFPQ